MENYKEILIEGLKNLKEQINKMIEKIKNVDYISEDQYLYFFKKIYLE